MGQIKGFCLDFKTLVFTSFEAYIEVAKLYFGLLGKNCQ